MIRINMSCKYHPNYTGTNLSANACQSCRIIEDIYRCGKYSVYVRGGGQIEFDSPVFWLPTG